MVISDNFNPHEREARDLIKAATTQADLILIHTSVKLVTLALLPDKPLVTTF